VTHDATVTSSGWYLQRCRSHLRRKLGDATVLGNAQLLVWWNGPTLAGVFLPSLRRFTIHRPAGAVALVAVGLDHLYMIAQPDGPGTDLSVSAARVPRQRKR